MRVFKARAALGSVAVALLTVALMAPTALAGPGNGGGQGHGKPADAGRSHGRGHESKPDKKVKQDKADKKAKPDRGSRPDKQDSPIEPAEAPAAPKGGPNFLAALPCKDGGWQTLQSAEGARFDNQGRCVSYAVRGGVIADVVPVVTISFVPALDAVDACDATAILGDFDPTTRYVGALTVGGGVPTGVDPITTDALGDASVPLGAFATGEVLVLTVNGVSSGDATVACPPEVEAPEG